MAIQRFVYVFAIFTAGFTGLLHSPDVIADERALTFARQTVLSHAYDGGSLPPNLALPENDPVHDVVAAMRVLHDDVAESMRLAQGVADEMRLSVASAIEALPSYQQRLGPVFMQDIEQFEQWAHNPSLTMKAQALRRVVLALRLIEADFYARGNPTLFLRSRHGLEDSEWRYADFFFKPRPLRLPCEVVARNASASIEAFSDLGDRPTRLKLASFLDCPVRNAFEGIPEPEDFLVIGRLFAGDAIAGDLDRLAPVRKPPRLPPSQPRIKTEVQPPAGAWTVDDARRWLDHDVSKAIAALEGSNTARDQLTLALVLHAFTDDHEQRVSLVLPILADLERSINPATLNSLDKLLIPDADYDGSDERMVEHVRYTTAAGGFEDAPIPCEVLIRSPGLLPAIEPFFGSGKDNSLPSALCPHDRYPLPDSYRRFEQQVRQPLRGWHSGLGTNRNAFAKSDAKTEILTRALPGVLAQREADVTPPFEAWSMLSLSNRRVYEALLETADVARRDLSAHYQERFGLDEKAADDAARVALFEHVYVGNWGVAPERGLRAMVFDGKPAAEIHEAIKRAGNISEVPYQPLKMAGTYDWAWQSPGLPEPLIMVAVHRPDVLSTLLTAPNDTTAPGMRGFAKEDLRTHVDAANGFGKTALMTAAQIDEPASVSMLLKAGANAGAVTFDARGKGGSRYLVHDLRNATMYAAGEGSIRALEIILQMNPETRGAVDSTGLRPLHYLLGYMDMQARDRLSNENLLNYAKKLNVFGDRGVVPDFTASFDCKQATRRDEELICNDPLLAVYDTLLSAVYRHALETTPEKAKSSLLDAQRAWLRERRKCGSNANAHTCILEQYQHRIGNLREAAYSGIAAISQDKIQT